MNATTQTTAAPETPSASLARIVEPLDARDALTLREKFDAMFAQVEVWQRQTADIVVTGEDQTGKMKVARALRLEMKSTRVEADKRRKAMKADVLLKGRAIDGAYAIFEASVAPLERHLLEQEQFGERAAKARAGALASARRETLLALGVAEAALPGGLGAMTDEIWAVAVEDARLAKSAREQAAREAEEARVEAERILRERRAAEKAEAAKREAERVAREEEQRAENARLRAEAQEREAAARAERERVEAERRAEREKADAERMAADAQRVEAERVAAEERAVADKAARAERDAIEAKARAEREEADRVAREELARVEAEGRARAEAAEKALAEERAKAEARKPTKAKYELLLRALQRIAVGDPAVNGAAIAREALESVGAAP